MLPLPAFLLFCSRSPLLLGRVRRVHPPVGNPSWVPYGAKRLILSLFAAALVPACDDDPQVVTDPVKVTPAEFGSPFDALSEWHLFADAQKQLPAERVEPYDVISPLFSDYTTKFRFIHIPEDATITYADDGVWNFPVGTILVKSFAYPTDVRDPLVGLRMIETRLLWREPDGWTAHTYVYDESGDAVRTVAGKFIPFEFVGTDGVTAQTDYHVPNTNECADCHANADVVGPLGPRTRQLDREGAAGNQVDRLFELGWFTGEPTAPGERVRLVSPDDEAQELELRVRSYFDANCGHCHTTGGSASQSALLLDFVSTAEGADTQANFGVCKIPTSADGATCGHTYDVVPGDPDSSVMVCRVGSDDIEVRMPPTGSHIVHREGLELVRAWIAAMPPDDCIP